MTADTIATGRSLPRKDSRSKTTGTALYTADIHLPGLLHACVLRSPHHHAGIRKVDITAAVAAPGVVAVLTSADLPAARTLGPFIYDQPVLADGRVRHVGEPVALVVAQSRQAAVAAGDLIKVDYLPLPEVLDPREALAVDAPAIHPAGNLCAEFRLELGSSVEGFSQAEIIVEDTFQLPRISPAYMEPEVSLASWQADGKVGVWTSSQKPFVDRAAIASVLGLPDEDVIVRIAEVGGAFGGKEDSILSVLAALAARHTRSSVLLANDRWESFVGHPKRHPAFISLKLGARKDGSLTAFSARIHLDTGAYASYGPAVGCQLTEIAPGPYRIPNIQVETSVCYTNSPYSGAMRGFGNPQVCFAVESLMDALASALGMHPVDFRRHNLLRPGDAMVTGIAAGEWARSLPGILDGAAEAYEQLARPGLSDEHSRGEHSAGVGMALALQPMGLGHRVPDRSTHRAAWLPDGTVQLFLGAPEIGQGLAGVAEQMLAEALGIQAERVNAASLDTSLVPDGGVTCASRMTFLVGNALALAARELEQQVINAAADLLAVDPSTITYHQGMIQTGAGALIPAAEIAARAAEMNRTLEAVGSADFPYPEEGIPDSLPVGMPHVMFVAGAHIARVVVDKALGMVDVTDLVAIHDAGKLINPAAALGQVHGGIAMGIGYALFEEMKLKSSEQWVSSFAEYLLPTSEDLPARVQVTFKETPESASAFGVKGLGEIVLVPTAPAITNAVHAATGIRITRLPVSPERIVSAEPVASG